MNKLFKILRYLFTSYLIGSILLLIIVIILGMTGIKVYPIYTGFKWTACIFIIGFLVRLTNNILIEDKKEN